MAGKAPATRIQRAGNGHSYFMDGEKVPGVTTILGNGIPKPGLIGWAANTVADFVMNKLAIREDGTLAADELVAALREWNASRPGWAQVKVSKSERLPRLDLAKVLANIRYADLDEASNKGGEVHQLAQKLAEGDEIDIPEALKGHVESYVRFLDEWDPTEALLERVVVNRRWRYMGKFDLLAYFDSLPDQLAEFVGDDHGWGLCDVKTARSGIFAEVALQLEGYRNAETMIDGAGEVPMPQVDFVAAIHVRADGYDVRPFFTDGTEFRTFLYAKQVGDWLAFPGGRGQQILGDALPAPTREGGSQ